MLDSASMGTRCDPRIQLTALNGQLSMPIRKIKAIVFSLPDIVSNWLISLAVVTFDGEAAAVTQPGESKMAGAGGAAQLS
jgi:hypothetical protein